MNLIQSSAVMFTIGRAFADAGSVAMSGGPMQLVDLECLDSTATFSPVGYAVNVNPTLADRYRVALYDMDAFTTLLGDLDALGAVINDGRRARLAERARLSA